MFVEDQQIDAFLRSQGLTFRIIEDLFERHNINRQEEQSVRIRRSSRAMQSRSLEPAGSPP
jgi:hypothetical protein